MAPARVQVLITLTDAENECEHGHLPLDRNPSCACWTDERIDALLAQQPVAQVDLLDTAALDGTDLTPAGSENGSRPAPVHPIRPARTEHAGDNGELPEAA